MKHLSLASLISLLLVVKADMEAAKQILDEMKGSSCTTEEFRMALDMRSKVYEERRMILDEIHKKGGFSKYLYAERTLCPFFI